MSIKDIIVFAIEKYYFVIKTKQITMQYRTTHAIIHIIACIIPKKNSSS